MRWLMSAVALILSLVFGAVYFSLSVFPFSPRCFDNHALILGGGFAPRYLVSKTYAENVVRYFTPAHRPASFSYGGGKVLFIPFDLWWDNDHIYKISFMAAVWEFERQSGVSFNSLSREEKLALGLHRLGTNCDGIERMAYGE